MKCTNCGTDNNLKDRTANFGRCKACNEPFAFEPSTMGEVKITDPLFATLIKDISVNNTLNFTHKQFLYFANRKLSNKKYKNDWSFCFIVGFITVWITLFVGGITNNFLLGLFLGLGVNIIALLITYQETSSNYLSIKDRKKKIKNLQILSVVVGIVYVFLGVINEYLLLSIAAIMVAVAGLFLGYGQKEKLSNPNINNTQDFLFQIADFDRWVERWTNIKGNIDQLLPQSLPQLSSDNNINPELLNYSFDRLLVCDRDEIAHFLITNNFHFENNCAILSINGYPQNVFNTVMQMVKNNPELQIYTIHNCSPEGIQLNHQLRTQPQWFSDRNLPIIDIGITPQQAIDLQDNIFIRYSAISARKAKTLPSEITQNLTPTDLKWLQSGNYVELESFTPQRLLQIIQRSISRANQLDPADNAIILIDDSSPNYIYTIDSFG